MINMNAKLKPHIMCETRKVGPIRSNAVEWDLSKRLFKDLVFIKFSHVEAGSSIT